MKKKEIKDRERNYEYARSECWAKVVPEDENKMEKLAQVVMVESAIIGANRNCWPGQWREFVMDLNIMGFALISKMEDKPEDKAKGREFARRMSQALDEVEKVFREMEHFMYDLVFDQERISKKGVSEEPDAPPVDYRPGQWAMRVGALTITGLALIGWMANKAKGHKFDDRVLTATYEVVKVFLEAEYFLFDLGEDSCAN